MTPTPNYPRGCGHIALSPGLQFSHLCSGHDAKDLIYLFYGQRLMGDNLGQSTLNKKLNDNEN